MRWGRTTTLADARASADNPLIDSGFNALCDTLVYMSTTITIRTEDPLRKRLEERAAATGKTLSALVREILESAVAERSLGRRAGHLKGCLTFPRDRPNDWKNSIRDRNWRG